MALSGPGGKATAVNARKWSCPGGAGGTVAGVSERALEELATDVAENLHFGVHARAFQSLRQRLSAEPPDLGRVGEDLAALAESRAELCSQIEELCDRAQAEFGRVGELVELVNRLRGCSVALRSAARSLTVRFRAAEHSHPDALRHLTLAALDYQDALAGTLGEFMTVFFAVCM